MLSLNPFTLIIRKATLEDAKRISYLIQKNTEANPNNYNQEQLVTWKKYNTPSRIKKQLTEREIFCAFENNKLAGTIGLLNNEIVGFYISPSKRGQGIGKKLFDFIQNQAKQKGYKTLILTSTPSAVKFYENKGFQQIKTVIVSIDDINYQEYNMIKTLT